MGVKPTLGIISILLLECKSKSKANALKRDFYFIFIFMDKDMQYVAEICSKQPFIALEWR